jgi:hypothetical protein
MVCLSCACGLVVSVFAGSVGFGVVLRASAGLFTGFTLSNLVPCVSTSGLDCVIEKTRFGTASTDDVAASTVITPIANHPVLLIPVSRFIDWFGSEPPLLYTNECKDEPTFSNITIHTLNI